MDSVKQTAIEAIKRLPDGCSLEDIMYQVYFISQVFEGLRDAQEGRVITSEELDAARRRLGYGKYSGGLR